jgi:hypothetical protein
MPDLSLSRRVAVMSTCGTRLVFHTQRLQAQTMIASGLAVQQDSKTLCLTCHPGKGIGQSLPQYHDGHTMLLARHYPALGSFIRW